MKHITEELKEFWSRPWPWEPEQMLEACREAAWDWLGRSLPMKPLSAFAGAEAFAVAMNTASRHERISPADAARAGVGRHAFEAWYAPIAEEVVECERLAAGLLHFGGSVDDQQLARRLRARVENLLSWLAAEVSTGRVPWLPEFISEFLPLDEWWRDEGLKRPRQRYRDLLHFQRGLRVLEGGKGER